MSTQQKHAELLRTQTHADENPSNKDNSSHELRKRYPVKDTPFTIVGSEQDGYFVTMGKYRLTEGGETLQECENRIKNKDWELIFAVMGVALETTQEELKRNKLDQEQKH